MSYTFLSLQGFTAFFLVCREFFFPPYFVEIPFALLGYDPLLLVRITVLVMILKFVPLKREVIDLFIVFFY